MPEKYLVTPATSPQITQQADSQAAQDSEQSAHSLALRRVREFTIPGLVRVVTFFAISLSFLVISNWQNILNVLNNSVARGTPVTVGLPNYLRYYTDNQIVSWLTIIIFWGTVGLAIYTLFWLVMAFFTAARNELIVETAFSNRGHFWDKVRVPMIKLVMLVCVAVMILVTLRIGAPVWSELFASGLSHLGGSSIFGAFQLLLALLGAMINLHILLVSGLIFNHAEAIF